MSKENANEMMTMIIKKEKKLTIALKRDNN